MKDKWDEVNRDAYSPLNEWRARLVDRMKVFTGKDHAEVSQFVDDFLKTFEIPVPSSTTTN